MTDIQVVIADDDASLVALLERLLTSRGHTVLTCDNSATAFELVQQHAPVLLIADWEIPGQSGLELCRKIRASPVSNGTYILLLTGNDEQTQIVAGLEAGADDYLLKTCSHTELLARVRAGTRLLNAHATIAERADLAELGADVGVALTRGDGLRAILQMCTAAVVQHLDAAFARIWTLNEKQGMLELQASAGMYTHIDGPHGRVPVGAFKIGLIAQERRPHLTNDVHDDPRIGDPDWARREGMVAFAGHPLIVGDRLVGVMALFARRPLSDIALKSLGSIADGIALGIQRRQGEEQQLRLVRALEAAAEAIILTDVNGNILQVNPAFTRITGYTADEAIDQTPRVLKSGTQNPEVYERMWGTIRSGEVWAGRVVNQRKSGAFYVAELTIAPITVDGGMVTGYVGVHRDVTRQVEREQELAAAKADAEDALAKLQEVHGQLMQADKMASIGHLAAGVAHEINNPIGFITSNLNSLSRYVTDISRVLVAHDELLDECQSGSGVSTAKAEEVVRVRKDADIDYVMSDLVDLIAESTDGAKRVRQIVADLKDFSHVDSPDVADEDVHAILDKTLSVACNELKYKTEVVREYGDIPVLPCYGGRLGQVFLNLLINAAQAIEERGTITIRTGHDGGRIWVEIADTGCGITPESVDRIFDPFFTTKGVGKGTGLGLHLVHKIIHAHGGRITVKSHVGEGTTFRIELPATGPPAVKESERESVT